MRLGRPAAWFLLLVLVSLAAFPAQAQFGNSNRGFDGLAFADAPIDIQPFSDVDHELFLVHALRLIYTSWPTSDDQKKVAGQIATLRSLAGTFRQGAVNRRTDRDVVAAYDNCLGLLSAYETYLTDIGKINSQTMDSVKQEGLTAVGKATLEGAGDKVFDGQSTQDALTAAAVKFAWEAIKSGIAITRERAAAIEAAKQRYISQSNAVLGNANAMVQRLAAEHRWLPGEATLEGSRESLREQASSRRRDPFVLYSIATVNEQNETAAGAMAKAEMCVRAAQLTPAGDAYNGLREGFIGQAVTMSLLASNLERPYYAGPPPSSAARALRLARTYLSLDPGDSTGLGHMQLGRALAFNGRYSEAIDAAYTASKQWGNDPSFAYRYAKLLSLTNSLDKSAELLKLAYSLGWTDVTDIRNTPDLDNLRRGRPQVFQQLTTGRVSPSIQFRPGWADDILIRNDSPFELTNVHFKATITNQGQKYTPDFTVRSIKPGQTFTESGTTMVFGNRYDAFTYTLACDQRK